MHSTNDIEIDILYEDGFNLVIDHLLWILVTLSCLALTINRSQLAYTGKIILIINDTPIKAPAIPMYNFWSDFESSCFILKESQ